jgi:D-alanyl-D-alanine carboxypeptidase
MRKIVKILVLIFLVFSVFTLVDHFYYSGQGDSESSFLAYVLASGEYLFNLVNKSNSLEKYAPNDLVELSKLGAPGKQIRQAVFPELGRMIGDAKKDGVNLKIISAYRAYERQRSLFSFYKKRFKDAESFSAEAGHSEHQLGTVVDFGSGSRVDLTAKFGQAPQGKWLADKAWQYGFMLSYPLGKEKETGYIFEPWHYRFIGVEAAGGCYELRLALQECLSQKPQYFEDFK